MLKTMKRISSYTKAQLLLAVIACLPAPSVAFAFLPTSRQQSKLFPIAAFVSPSYPTATAIAATAISTTGLRATQEEEVINDKEETIANEGPSIDDATIGLYRPFADHAWSKLLGGADCLFVTDPSVPTELSSNEAPAKGMPAGSIVRMTNKALIPASPEAAKVVRYARYALLETLVPTEPTTATNNNSTAGIQVLNLVIFPAASTNLPVFGADVVSLPGNRHLLLLDAQPMDSEADYPAHWKDWHQQYVVGHNNSNNNNEEQSFPWGGDIPEEVAKYVSENALWARLIGGGSADDAAAVDPITKIQTDFWDAYQEHLDLYLKLLADSASTTSTTSSSNTEQAPYVEYRRNNDPAKPMLKSLYGEEWTERILQEVLFPTVPK